MSKPRALFLLNLPPPVHGMAMMGKYVMDSKTVNDAFDARYVRTTMARSLADIGHGALRKIPVMIGFLARVRREIAVFRPELVYFTPNTRGGAFVRDAVTLACVKRWTRRRVPIVLHFHNKGVAAGSRSALFRFLYRRFFRDVTVMLLSPALYADVEAFVPRERVVFCPNGVPPSRPLDAAPIVRSNAVPRVLFLSNLLIAKGIAVFLDALALLRERGAAFRADVVGGEADWTAADFAREADARGLSETVTYHGAKYGDEKRAFLECADVFAFPSMDETIGIVAIEAMEYGLPVVASDVGGVRDAVLDGVSGVVLPTVPVEENGARTADAADLADALGRLLADPDMRVRMGAASRSAFLERFTLARFEETFVRNLTSALGGR